MTADEAQLLARINQGLPVDLQRRYEELIDRRRAETLALDELAELLRLTDDTEALEVKRLEALAELARVRRVPLATLMANLAILVPSDGW